MSGGRFIAVVGPSGVGKDSVIQRLVAARSDLHRVRRVITRPESAGGEDFIGVDRDGFAGMVEADAFLLHWDAHGLRYGIPRATTDVLERGDDVIANLSRTALRSAQAAVPRLVVVALTARPDVLAARLAGRGRETAEDIAGRLERAKLTLPEGLDVVELDNSGALDATVSTALNALYGERG